MELRVLQYFLAVTQEQNVLWAAESLNLSHPTLSRQIRDMEEELGKQLSIRGSRTITLTKQDMILRKRAEKIMELVKKAEDKIADTVGSGGLCFRPLDGQPGATMYLIWKKCQLFTKAAEKFLERLQQ